MEKLILGTLSHVGHIFGAYQVLGCKNNGVHRTIVHTGIVVGMAPEFTIMVSAQFKDEVAIFSVQITMDKSSTKTVSYLIMTSVKSLTPNKELKNLLM